MPRYNILAPKWRESKVSALRSPVMEKKRPVGWRQEGLQRSMLLLRPESASSHFVGANETIHWQAIVEAIRRCSADFVPTTGRA